MSERPADLARIARLVTRRAEGRDELREAIVAARAQGRSWSMIGKVLGISRQAAREQFGGVR